MEKHVELDLSRRHRLPTDPARARRLVVDYSAFYSNYYARIYSGAELDSDLASRVLNNPDCSDADRSVARLALYLKDGKSSELTDFLLSSRFAPGFFVTVKDPDVAQAVLGIVSRAYSEVTVDPSGPPGENTRLVGDSWPSLAAIQYVQKGGAISVAQRLFRDCRTFGLKVPMDEEASPADAALLLQPISRQACGDLIYALYANGDGINLRNIKSCGTELSNLVQETGEKYKSDVRRTFDAVGLGRTAGNAATMPAETMEGTR